MQLAALCRGHYLKADILPLALTIFATRPGPHPISDVPRTLDFKRVVDVSIEADNPMVVFCFLNSCRFLSVGKRRLFDKEQELHLSVDIRVLRTQRLCWFRKVALANSQIPDFTGHKKMTRFKIPGPFFPVEQA